MKATRVKCRCGHEWVSDYNHAREEPFQEGNVFSPWREAWYRIDTGAKAETRSTSELPLREIELHICPDCFLELSVVVVNQESGLVIEFLMADDIVRWAESDEGTSEQ